LFNPTKASTVAMGGLEGPTQFQAFYPQEADLLLNITNTVCAIPLSIYRLGFSTDNATVREQHCVDALECVLENSKEVDKATMAAQGIVLALLPVVLAILGSNTTEIGFLSSRRPLLSFLLSCGGPVVNPRRLFEPLNVAQVLESRKTSLHVPETSATVSAMIVATEYTLALASVANLAWMGYELGYKTVTLAGQCSDRWSVLFWTYVAFAIHLLSATLFALSTRIEEVDSPASSKRTAIQRILRREFTLGAKHPPAVLRERVETPLQLVVSVLLTVCIVAHIIWGTKTFGAILFVFGNDCLAIIVRYIASTLVCRMITAFELSGMRSRIVVAVDEDDMVTASPSEAPGGQKIMKPDVTF
jgi:hypothetical protein